MAPYSQRRHRLNPGEIEPVRDAALEKLLVLLRDMDPLTLEEAQSLFRIWYRIAYHVRNKPAYPPHETWPEIAIWMEYGEDSLDAYGTEKEGRAWCNAPRGAHIIGHTRTASSHQNPTTDVLERSLTLKTTEDRVKEAEQ